MTTRLAVLASGTGTLLAAMIEQKLPIAIVITDRDCPALAIAQEAGIKRLLLRRTFRNRFDRNVYTAWMLRELKDHDIDLVAMAGFMTVFSPLMFAEDAYQMRILNTHPSLLPEFKGHYAVEDALAAGVKRTGCTIHYATEDVDEGPIIAKQAVPVLAGDTVATLHERIKVEERKLYPKIILDLLA